MGLSLEKLTEVYEYIRRLCGSRVPYPDYEDVAIEAFIGLMVGVGAKNYRAAASIKTYAHSITKNKINDWLRRKYRMRARRDSEQFQKDYVNFLERPVYERVFEAQEVFAKFMRGVEVCTPRQAEAVRLRLNCDMTAKEGAEKMGITERMFLTHVHNGIRKMLVRFCDEKRSVNKS